MKTWISTCGWRSRMRGPELSLVALLLVAGSAQADSAIPLDPLPDPELLELIATWQAVSGGRNWLEALDLGLWLAGASGREEERVDEGKKRAR